MTCDEFKKGFFRMNGPECPSELCETVKTHADSCASCGEIFRETLKRFVGREFERVYGDPNGPDEPAFPMPLPPSPDEQAKRSRKKDEN